MNNFGYQRQRTTGGTIENNAAISFDNLLINYDSTIGYDETNSLFTLANDADYFVSWFVTIKTGLGISGPDISLVTNDDPALVFPSTNSMKTGQLSGSALIRTSSSLSTPTIQLVNRTGDSIVLADNVSITANIVIIQINPVTAGINLIVTNKPGVTLDGGSTIPFDATLNNFNNLITNNEGVISITNPGQYIVDWHVSLDGSLDANSIKFNLVNVSGSDEIVIGTSESPVVLQRSFYGNAIVNAINASSVTPYVIKLVSASTDSNNNLTSITLSDIGIQGTIRIIQL